MSQQHLPTHSEPSTLEILLEMSELLDSMIETCQSLNASIQKLNILTSEGAFNAVPNTNETSVEVYNAEADDAEFDEVMKEIWAGALSQDGDDDAKMPKAPVETPTVINQAPSFEVYSKSSSNLKESVPFDSINRASNADREERALEALEEGHSRVYPWLWRSPKYDDETNRRPAYAPFSNMQSYYNPRPPVYVAPQTVDSAPLSCIPATSNKTAQSAPLCVHVPLASGLIICPKYTHRAPLAKSHTSPELQKEHCREESKARVRSRMPFAQHRIVVEKPTTSNRIYE
ncbi:hypothetical protein CVT24_007557 [Panaeolus cyanescens]|uniref:Uncharacterized protein n=1 Tax=Panaeolus cyanescens TaxID=181874 RepID=A0A409YWM6_9AGAR|nr:hypothetical protein CVT24_007557 [Panaeolus cyanescens]